jgi:hypothetical protein
LGGGDGSPHPDALVHDSRAQHRARRRGGIRRVGARADGLGQRGAGSPGSETVLSSRPRGRAALPSKDA